MAELSLVARAVDVLIVGNGVYDLICFASILFLGDTYGFGTLSRLHRGIYRDHSDSTNPIAGRLLAYWLACYGAVRVAQLSQTAGVTCLVAFTYALEAFAWSFEYFVHQTAERTRAVLVVTLSLAMTAIALARAGVAAG